MVFEVRYQVLSVTQDGEHDCVVFPYDEKDDAIEHYGYLYGRTSYRLIELQQVIVLKNQKYD